ncbi:caspase family protein [Desulfobacterota bacterium AH_259_B03_O07]|nr:caspase family protein [Desulfobacterota bacterium AH_259_B03_O07]
MNKPKLRCYGIHFYFSLLIFFVLFQTTEIFVQKSFGQSQVACSHINQINRLFRQNGIDEGFVNRDKYGRVELKGTYRDEREVDLGFSLAQTVVGVKLVSPVTPENIKVKEWEKCLERILSGQIRGRCGPKAVSPVDFSGIPPGPVAEKYALVVGINKYKNGIEPLKYASKDALDFYSFLVNRRGGNFRKENVILFRDEYATRVAIENALDKIQNLAKEDDLVLLYFSSHGTPPGKFGGVHIVTYDSEVKPRQRIWETSITGDILREFIRGVRAKRLIVIIDACYSNGAYNQIAGFLPTGSKSLGDEGFGISRRYMTQRLLGAKGIVVEESSSNTPPQDSKSPNGWGIVLVSASDAGELSWESDILQGGIFTHYFLQGLNRYNGTVKEAFYYSKPLINSRVKEEQGIDMEQNPHLTPSQTEWNMSLAVSGR